jgi:hypothetical protein
MDAMPGELVHRPAPDDGLLAAVAEDHDEGIDGRRPVGVAEMDPSELAPITLGLGPGRRFDPPERADRRLAVACSHIFANRLVRAVIAVLGAEKIVEELNAERPLLSQNVDLRLPPVVDDLGQTPLLDSRGLVPSIGGLVTGASEVITDRTLGDAEDSRRLGLRLASLLQDLDRHDMLPCELCQVVASERAWDVQVQLESARRACRWMFSTTVVLNICKARNDSGSLSSGFADFEGFVG